MATKSGRNLALGVNPEILRWARERAGYSLEDVAKVFHKSIEDVEKWEIEEAYPTYTQLDKLAYVLYERPITLFFFPAPPWESDPKQSFRTLPKFEIDSLSQATRYAMDKMKVLFVPSVFYRQLR